jgi:hypothetical protein
LNQQQLKEHLEQLTSAIQDMQATASDKERLSKLIIDIEQQISDPILDNEAVSLTEQVDSLVTSFETDHPAVAGILNNIMVTLSSMGV